MPKKARKEKQLSPSWWIAYGVVCGLGAAGLVLLLSTPRRGKPIELLPASTVAFSEALAIPTSSLTSTPEATPTTSFPININTASAEELQQLPNVGPVLAGAIISYRDFHGPFIELGQLMNVSGIGQRTFEALQPMITLGEVTLGTATPS